jgi:hypothetical protein
MMFLVRPDGFVERTGSGASTKREWEEPKLLPFSVLLFFS